MERFESNYLGFYSDSNKFPCLLWGLAESTQNDYRKKGGQWSTPEMAVAPVLIYDRKIAQLEKEIRELREMLTSAIQSQEAPVIELRDIPTEQAKEEIAKYFRENDGRIIDEGELIDELGIEPLTVVQACRILMEERKIGRP
ncbi:MAG: hypothetical protein ABH969_10075 [Pseudomonadota bacterium]